MRLKNVKNAKDIINNSKYIVLNPYDYKGKWNSLFKNNNPINIEIGMGKGNFIIKMAKKNKDINFIGIEMFDSVIVRAVQKLENEDIPNLKLIRLDANYIEDIFYKEINTIYLNFSDPWPKKRHAKRRLTSHLFLEKYDNIFKFKKEIIQKRIILICFLILYLHSTYGYTLDYVTLDLLSENDPDNVLTEYESKFNSKGVRICKLVAHKD